MNEKETVGVNYPFPIELTKKMRVRMAILTINNIGEYLKYLAEQDTKDVKLTPVKREEKKEQNSD